MVVFFVSYITVAPFRTISFYLGHDKVFVVENHFLFDFRRFRIWCRVALVVDFYAFALTFCGQLLKHSLGTLLVLRAPSFDGRGLFNQLCREFLGSGTTVFHKLQELSAVGFFGASYIAFGTFLCTSRFHIGAMDKVRGAGLRPAFWSKSKKILFCKQPLLRTPDFRGQSWNSTDCPRKRNQTTLSYSRQPRYRPPLRPSCCLTCLKSRCQKPCFVSPVF
jgi:hypothetical protein